ncbi:unnamed protein product [Angiostrongylus costaricensis]|uniref:Secreted protein n=1 Tax=Angiostrongylus costaricensis TaxID=334426 RepID=A0A0R3PHB8_ANGCS|nr:unnamed protein product [Angiostrongylus costaricensis]
MVKHICAAVRMIQNICVGSRLVPRRCIPYCMDEQQLFGSVLVLVVQNRGMLNGAPDNLLQNLAIPEHMFGDRLGQHMHVADHMVQLSGVSECLQQHYCVHYGVSEQ